MDRRALGSLAIWHDVPDDGGDMLAWYNHEHHPERLAIPGFLSMRRYHAIRASTDLFIRYQTESPDVLSSPAYLARLNDPTPWSLRNQRAVTNFGRIVCRLARRTGQAEGGVVAALRTFGRADAMAETAIWDRIEAEIAARPGVLAAELLVTDEALSTIPSREKELRGAPDQPATGVLILHGSDSTAVEELADTLRALPGLGQDESELGLYSLAYALTNDEPSTRSTRCSDERGLHARP